MYRLLTPAFLMAVCLVQLFAPGPPQAAAEGALAVGITGDVAKDGYSIGIAYNIKTEEEARQGALEGPEGNRRADQGADESDHRCPEIGSSFNMKLETKRG